MQHDFLDGVQRPLHCTVLSGKDLLRYKGTTLLSLLWPTKIL